MEEVWLVALRGYIFLIVLVNYDEDGLTIRGDGFPGDCKTNLLESD
jgi:hypothetical protein